MKTLKAFGVIFLVIVALTLFIILTLGLVAEDIIPLWTGIVEIIIAIVAVIFFIVTTVRLDKETEEIKRGTEISILQIALQSKTGDLLSESKDSNDYLKKLDTRKDLITKIRKESPVVKFPINGKHIKVAGHMSRRGFWVDSEKNKTYFQLSTCPCPKCDNIILTFSPKNKFSYVLAPEYFNSKANSEGIFDIESYEVYAEIDGVVELKNDKISEFLQKKVYL